MHLKKTLPTLESERRGWGQRFRGIGTRLTALINRLLNHSLSESTSIQLRIGWPLLLLPLSLFNQLLAPHPVWIVLLIVIAGIYGVGIGWLRHQLPNLELLRVRDGDAVAAGDPLNEQFELQNHSALPALWVAAQDFSDLPGYNPGRVVACGASSTYKWQTNARCGQRGIFRLGPSALRWGDPFGLFLAEKQLSQAEQIVIYPRVAQLPNFQLPYGSVGGSRQLHHPLIGSIRSASVRQYQPGDTLRHVHWPATARHRTMMVTELDAEHGGEVWIVLDLNVNAQSGEGMQGTLEYSITVAASLAAQLLNSNERLAVGLLLAVGTDGVESEATSPNFSTGHGIIPTASFESISKGLQTIPPQAGQAQFWQIMGALAMAQAVPISLSQLLQSSRSMITSRQSLIVITPHIDPQNPGGLETRALEDPLLDNNLDSTPDNTPDSTPDNTLGPANPVEPRGRVNPIDTATAAPATHQNDADWLDELARSKHGRRNSVILIQDDNDDTAEAGAEMLTGHLGGVMSDNEPTMHEATAEQRQLLLSQHEVSCTILYTSNTLVPINAQRRIRKEARTTPMGGIIMVEVEEEVA